MKILLLSPYLPHPRCGHGGGIVVYRLMQALALRHTVDLICFARDEVEQRLAKDLGPLCRRMEVVRHDYEHIPKGKRIGNLLGPYPAYVAHSEHPRLRAALNQHLASDSYDAIQIEFIFFAHYARGIRHQAIFLDTIDTYGKEWRGVLASPELSLIRRLYTLADGWKSDAFTMRVLRLFRGIFAFTAEDRDWILARNPRLPVGLRGPGVQVPERAPRPNASSDRILFVGSFKHPSNVDGLGYFLDEVFPRVRSQRPNATLQIAGAPPPEQWKGRPGVEVLGFVDDLAPLYARADLCIGPVRFGGGVRTKILEAMAYGVPVVTTPAGLEGTGARESLHLAIAHSPSEYAERIRELLADHARAEGMGQEGRAFVQREHGIEKVLADVEPAYLAAAR